MSLGGFSHCNLDWLRTLVGRNHKINRPCIAPVEYNKTSLSQLHESGTFKCLAQILARLGHTNGAQSGIDRIVFWLRRECFRSE